MKLMECEKCDNQIHGLEHETIKRPPKPQFEMNFAQGPLEL